MMKLARYILLAATGLAGAATAQTQGSGGGRLEIVGDAPTACAISGPATAIASNATVETNGASSSRVRITEMVNPGNAQAMPVDVALSLPVVCNAPHRILLKSGNGGLLRQGASASRAQGGFSEFLTYQLGAAWGGQQYRGASDGAGGLVIQSPTGAAGQVAVSINVPGGGQPLVAGNYSDEIIIEFQAAN